MTTDLPPVYGGQILHVDLDSGESEQVPVEERDARRFLGGNGFVAQQVAEHVPIDADPLGPENVLAMAVGPMNATAFQSTSRAVLGFLSPMTDGFFDSTFGGTLPQAFKTTGFDVLVIHGQAAELCYLLVTEEGAELRPAPELAGMDTYETCQAIREREGVGYDTHVLANGPAGEQQVRFACLLHDSKMREGVAGRGGSGAVLGAKQLKAIAVQGGEFQPEPAGDLRGRSVEQLGGLLADTEMLQDYGTAGLVNPVNEMGKLGHRNLQTEQAPAAAAEAVSGERLREAYVTEDTTCANCAVRCGKHVSVEGMGITEAKIPEFESLFGTATLQEVYDIEQVIAVNDRCDRLGMDTISWGVTVAYARECAQRGLLEEDSPHLDFGDGAGLNALAEQTAARERVGDLLAEGSARMARRLAPDASRYLYETKGLEMAAHSARGLKGMSIGYATATRGGSHHDTRPTRQYEGLHAETTEGTAAFAARSQHFTALGDSLTQCRFVSEAGWGKEINEAYAEAINLATGWDLDLEEVETIGERVYNLERLINVARGVASRRTDTLPERVQQEPIPDGPAAGLVCTPEELATMLEEYYEFRGWSDRGHPTEATVSRLDIEDVAASLRA